MYGYKSLVVNNIKLGINILDYPRVVVSLTLLASRRLLIS